MQAELANYSFIISLFLSIILLKCVDLEAFKRVYPAATTAKRATDCV